MSIIRISIYILLMTGSLAIAIFLFVSRGTSSTVEFDASGSDISYNPTKSSSICLFENNAEKCLYLTSLDILLRCTPIKNVGYSDVFDTDCINFGLRIEFDSNGRGCVLFGDSKGKCYDGIMLPEFDFAGKPTLIWVKFDKGFLSVDQDGILAGYLSSFREISVKKVIVGNGFDGSRSYPGTIDVLNFHIIAHKYMPPRLLFGKSIRGIVSIVFFMIHLVAVGLLIVEMKNRPEIKTVE